MLGDGGKLYWVRNPTRMKTEGIVVVFGWVSVTEEQLSGLVDLYGDLRWDSLVCAADFFDAFNPERATSLALCVLLELLQEDASTVCGFGLTSDLWKLVNKELRKKARPLVFVALSGGSKACLYKVLQIVQGTFDVQLNQADNQLVRSCTCGIVFDSGPVDFTSDLVARFSMNPRILRLPGATKFMSWVAKGLTFGLDAVFLTGFESQRADYWLALKSSVSFGAPYLILCSENDKSAPYEVISCFAQHLRNAGGDVQVVKWDDSPHAGHYKRHPAEYKAAMSSLLVKSGHVFSRKVRQLELLKAGIQCMHEDDSDLFHKVPKAIVIQNQSHQKVELASPDESPMQNQNDRPSVQLINPAGINPHSVLGKALFDACVPRNIEGWDIKSNCTINGQPLATARRQSPPLGIKYTRRSKL